MLVKFILNGEDVAFDAYPGETLFELLRRNHHTEVKGNNCKTGECGACTVLIDGEPVPSCTYLAGKINGKNVITVKGIGDYDNPNIIQKIFVEEGAIQCGYCIPGIIISVKNLLDKVSNPTEEDIKIALSSHICRCTGYVQQIDATKKLIEIMKGEKK
ncbi:MAG: (2Fe-2S)-binding protein [Caldisericia bacterium]|jgi:carbon-monoxide dehydrogenase small subunit|nr:(2Fe-2S)-binding protein [Caldisericia bacterium]